MIPIKKGKAPKVLETKGKLVAEQHQKDFESGVKKFLFDEVYRHKDVKSLLLSEEIQNDKCCFCESNITATGYGDVEHFRPKAAWKQKDEDKLSESGYYWLAYSWDNLFLSCQICNQQFKKNFFALENPTERALNHTHDIELEKPLMIDPSKDDPSEHLLFREKYVKSISLKGTETIKRTGIDRTVLDERREFVYSVIFGQLNLLTLLESNQLTHPKAQDVIQNLKKMISPKQPYFAMLRDNFTNQLAEFGIIL